MLLSGLWTNYSLFNKNKGNKLWKQVSCIVSYFNNHNSMHNTEQLQLCKNIWFHKNIGCLSWVQTLNFIVLMIHIYMWYHFILDPAVMRSNCTYLDSSCACEISICRPVQKGWSDNRKVVIQGGILAPMIGKSCVPNLLFAWWLIFNDACDMMISQTYTQTISISVSFWLVIF